MKSALRWLARLAFVSPWVALAGWGGGWGAGCGAGGGGVAPAARALCALDAEAGAALHAQPATPQELSALQGCRRLASLRVRTGAALDLGALHALQEVDGDLTLGPSLAIDAAALPGLRRVGGELRVTSNGALSAVLVPALQEAAQLVISHNPALATVSAPNLSRARRVALEGNAELEVLLLTGLAQVEELALDGSPRLAVVELARLQTVGRWVLGEVLGPAGPALRQQAQAQAGP